MNAILSETSSINIKPKTHDDVLRRIEAYTNPKLGAKGVGKTKQISPVDKAVARSLVARDLQLERVRKELKKTAETAKTAIIDPLTKLYNRKYLDGDENAHPPIIGELERLYERAKRDRLPLGVVIVDIDNFGDVNGTYGHLVGDEVLRNVALLIQTHIRKGDIVVRYGGDEILLLLPDTKLEGVSNLAEKLRNTVQVYHQVYHYHSDDQYTRPDHVDISLGAMSFDPNNSTLIKDKKTLIQVVDKALYFSKQNGRNRTTIVEETEIVEGDKKTRIWHFI